MRGAAMKSRKKLSAPLSAAIAFLLFLSVIFAAESLTSALTLRLDMTEDGLYTLSDTTVDVLSHLSAPVTVTVFSNETDFVPLVHETLLRYQALSDQMVSIRYVDPYTHPSEVKRWQNQGFTITEGTLAVEGQFTAEVIQLEDLFITDGETVTALQIEQPLTSAIARGGRSETLRAQFIEGHDESYSEGFQTLLRQNGFSVGRTTLSVSDPACDLMILAAPKTDYLPDEIAKIQAFMNDGGRLMVFLSSEAQAMPRLAAFLAEWGVGMTDIVVGDRLQYVDANPLSIVPIYAAHDINARFSGLRIYPVLTSTLALRSLYTQNGTTSTAKVLYSTDKAYAADGSDTLAAPFVLAMTAERKNIGESSRLFVCGSSGLYADNLLDNAAFANSMLLAQAIGWSTERHDTLGIPARSLSSTPIAITAGQLYLFAGLFIVGLPAFYLLVGLTVYLRRRHL